MISIVIPSYNKSHLIGSTLTSVLQQTFQDFEIIIVDDGSTDRSIQKINEFSEHRMTILQQQNAGVSAARNNGIKHAHGDWIAFLDADDWWHPKYLENINNIILSQPNAKVVSTGYFCKPDSPNWQPKTWPLPSKPLEVEVIKNLPERWLQSIPFFTSSICINKDFLQTIQPWFPEGESNGEDLDLWLRIAEKNSIYYQPTELVVYRTDQSTSLTNQHKSLQDPPFIKRMQTRAHSKDFPIVLKNDTLIFAAQHKISRARQAILLKNRMLALKLLMTATYAIKTKRWWLTLLMIFFFPRSHVQKWQNKRSGTKELTQ